VRQSGTGSGRDNKLQLIVALCEADYIATDELKTKAKPFPDHEVPLGKNQRAVTIKLLVLLA
jgi:hypothetical protein